jgi:hypothetical protein
LEIQRKSMGGIFIYLDWWQSTASFNLHFNNQWLLTANPEVPGSNLGWGQTFVFWLLEKRIFFSLSIWIYPFQSLYSHLTLVCKVDQKKNEITSFTWHTKQYNIELHYLWEYHNFLILIKFIFHWKWPKFELDIIALTSPALICFVIHRYFDYCLFLNGY